MPLQPWMKLLSTDDHLIEPPRLWSDRLPAKYREQGPRIIDQPRAAGQAPAEVWTYEGRVYPYIGLNAVAGKKLEDFGMEPTRYDEMIPGCYDPKARLRDMDLDGMWGALCFPSFPRFAGTVFLEGEDRTLAMLSVQAWNDYVLDEWCTAGEVGRLIPLSILPLWDVQACVAEIHRVAAKGSKAISFPENPAPLGLPSFHSDHWDPVFSALEETDMPLCLHFGTSGKPPYSSPDAPFAVTTTLFATNSMAATTELLFSPVLHNHPKLKVGLSEGGIGWIPYLLERIDSVWTRHRFYQNINQDVLPSDLFHKHFHGCFIDDKFGVEVRHHIGVDKITWECDYPHSDSYWPKSRAYAEEVFTDVPDGEVHKMVELNTRRLYNLPA
ncbi:amidohydrolase family protein [Nocardia sp. NPDC006630]|uniref:amidohydrolase family protein n=1 Tax=Nocardia sp. NPDC006630 TaxID=3157181 RepID=UPI0033A94318